MRRTKARFSWVIFSITLPALLTVGSLIAVFTSSTILELVKNIVILIFVSVLLSVVSGYWKSVWNILSKILLALTKRIATTYIRSKIKEYNSEIRILGLKNNSGTVNLILEAGINDGVSPGTMLTIVTEPGGERYGEVQVTELDSIRSTAAPTNRINTEFWEQLEDRMRSNPSPPLNVVAKRQIPDALVESFGLLLQKENKHGY